MDLHAALSSHCCQCEHAQKAHTVLHPPASRPHANPTIGTNEQVHSCQRGSCRHPSHTATTAAATNALPEAGSLTFTSTLSQPMSMHPAVLLLAHANKDRSCCHHPTKCFAWHPPLECCDQLSGSSVAPPAEQVPNLKEPEIKARAGYQFSRVRARSSGVLS